MSEFDLDIRMIPNDFLMDDDPNNLRDCTPWFCTFHDCPSDSL